MKSKTDIQNKYSFEDANRITLALGIVAFVSAGVFWSGINSQTDFVIFVGVLFLVLIATMYGLYLLLMLVAYTKTNNLFFKKIINSAHENANAIYGYGSTLIVIGLVLIVILIILKKADEFIQKGIIEFLLSEPVFSGVLIGLFVGLIVFVINLNKKKIYFKKQ